MSTRICYSLSKSSPKHEKLPACSQFPSGHVQRLKLDFQVAITFVRVMFGRLLPRLRSSLTAVSSFYNFSLLVSNNDIVRNIKELYLLLIQKNLI